MAVELESWLAANEDVDPAFLNEPAVVASGIAESPLWDPLLGRRLGPYEIQEKIGAGGMGEVYRAVRADDEYQGQVAIKLVHAGLASDFVLRRLRQERQILATLDHPHITRLLDGGTTSDGVPFLVMELIDGEPIHRFCERRYFDIEQRLRLFVHVCLAVHYAHQRLIIHRDIKPGNILVTPAGEPKLLDFGISKILDSGIADSLHSTDPATVSVIRLFTPAYASPEQLKGEQVTTGSDIYSLGVVLHELLTGRMPHDPGRTRALGIDVDSIIRMAIRPEPEHRYSSAEMLATDIRNHLDRLPVTARRNTLQYRLSTFVARHASAVAASALLSIALLAAAVVSIYEAREAQTERARAERRFDDARRLANSLMRDIYGAIKDLPGATPARKIVVTKALEYLDSLSTDAVSDPALEHEIALAYSLVGDVQGNPYYANLGNPAGALDSYRKALAIRLHLRSAAPSDDDTVRELAGSYNQIGSELGVMREFSSAVAHYEAAIQLLEPVDRNSRDPKVLDQLAGTYYYLTEAAVRTGELELAVDSIHRASAIRDSIVAADPLQQRQIRTHSAADHAAAARVFAAQKQFERALVEQHEAIDIVSTLAAEDANDATAKSYVGQGFNYLGELEENAGDRTAASMSYRQANDVLEPILAADRQNTFALGLVAQDYERLGVLEVKAGDDVAGSRDIGKAITLLTRASANEVNNPELSAQLANAYKDRGDSEYAQATAAAAAARSRRPRWEAACTSYRKSLDVWQALKQRGSLDAIETAADSPAIAAKSLNECESRMAAMASPPEPPVARSKP